jgi:hypothetical protein
MAWLTLAVWPPLGLMTPEMAVRWLRLGTLSLPDSLTGDPSWLLHESNRGGRHGGALEGVREGGLEQSDAA